MNTTHCPSLRRLFLPLFSLALSLGYADAQVTFVDSGSAVGSNSYDTAALGGFDPTGADKIVVTVHDETSAGPPSVSYAGDPMELAASFDNDGRFVAIYYRDYDLGSPAAAGTLSAPGSNGVSIVALQGTDDGFGAFATDTGSSIDLDALYNDSAVVVGFVANQNSGSYTGTAGGSMTGMLEDANVGSSLGVSGYAVGVAAGSVNYPFVGLSSTNGQMAAVAFPADGADTAAPIITSTSATDEVGNPDTSLLTQPTLTVAFAEGIFAGSGSIELRESGGALVEEYDVVTSSNISFDSTSFTITPSILDPSTSYYLDIPSGRIADGPGNTTGYSSILPFTTGSWLSGSYRVGGGGPYLSTTDLEGFDPTGYDKLIITVSDEGGSVSGVTLGGLIPEDPTAAFTEVATNPDFRYVTMYYVDAVDAPGGSFSDEFSITLSGSLSGYGFSLLALSGTASGDAAASDNASATSIDFTTTSDDSIVVAAITDNGGPDIDGVSPLTTYFSRDVSSSAGGAGVTANSTIGLQTFSFTGATSSPSMVIAEFAIAGGGGGSPEIAVEQNSVDIPNSTGSKDFGTATIGTDNDLIFTILNTGDAVLNLTDSPDLVTISGDADFSIEVQPATNPVPVTSGSTTFTVRFSPASSGARTATVSIANDDSDENPFTFSVTGTGQTAYEEWAGGTSLPFDGDGNGDGVQDGIAFLLGAASPGTDAIGLLPEPSESGDDLVLTFSMLKAADSGGATLSVQHSSDLGDTDAWAAVLVPDETPVSQDPIVNFSIDGSGSLNVVTATIDSSAGSGGKLFGRLLASE